MSKNNNKTTSKETKPSRKKLLEDLKRTQADLEKIAASLKELSLDDSSDTPAPKDRAPKDKSSKLYPGRRVRCTRKDEHYGREGVLDSLTKSGRCWRVKLDKIRGETFTVKIHKTPQYLQPIVD